MCVCVTVDEMEEVLPGFRFYPTEEELVSFYLYHKLRGTRNDIDRIIPVVDIYKYNPWDLPQVGGESQEQWFFFSRRQEREARGGRPNRLTAEGYWKATGSPGDVYSSQNCVIGRKRTMVFYVGRAPNGTKTCWKMNEYKAILSDHSLPSSSSSPPNQQLREELSLCRIYKTSRSFRAFDRRPPSEAAASGSQAAAQLNCPLISTTSNMVNPFRSMENDNIPESESCIWDYEQIVSSFHDE